MTVTVALLNNSEYGVDYSDPMELSSIDDLLNEVVEDSIVWEKLKNKDYTISVKDGHTTVYIDIR